MCWITSCFLVVNQLHHLVFTWKDATWVSIVCLSFSRLFFTPLTCCINRKRDTHTHLGDGHTTASGDGIPVLRETQCHPHGKVTVFSVHQDLDFSCLLCIVFLCVYSSVLSIDSFSVCFCTAWHSVDLTMSLWHSFLCLAIPWVASSLLRKEVFTLLIADSSELLLKQLGWLLLVCCAVGNHSHLQ